MWTDSATEPEAPVGGTTGTGFAPLAPAGPVHRAASGEYHIPREFASRGPSSAGAGAGAGVGAGVVAGVGEGVGTPSTQLPMARAFHQQQGRAGSATPRGPILISF